MVQYDRFAKLLTIATITFAIGLYGLLPAGIVPFDDSFGYLRSVVLTFQSGCPKTHDWLEPWAATQSALSALIFALTDSFTTAIFFPQVFGGAATFALAALVLRDRGFPTELALVAAFSLTSMPIVLWKWMEFSALIVYLPCFVAALWGADRGRWWQFFLFWAIAVASRQSAVIWLAIPAWHMATTFVRELRSSRNRQIGLRRGFAAVYPLLLWFVFSASLVLILAIGMNQTHSRTMVTANTLRHFHLEAFGRTFVIGIAVLVMSIGLASMTLVVAERRPLFDAWRRHRSRTFLIAVAVAALLVFGWQRIAIGSNGWSFGYSGRIYVGLSILLVLAGWLSVVPRIQRGYLIASVACVLLLSFRIVIHEYYFIDVFAFGFMAAIGRPQTGRAASLPMRAARPRLRRGATAIVFAIIFVLHGYFAMVAKATLDRSYGIVTLAEQALRRGDLVPMDLVFAPFGYIGWKLHSYFIAHEGRNEIAIAGFINYLDAWPVIVIDRHFPQRELESEKSGKMVAAGLFPAVPLPLKITLIRERDSEVASSPRKRAIARSVEPFPLNDEEWQSFIRDEFVAAP